MTTPKLKLLPLDLSDLNAFDQAMHSNTRPFLTPFRDLGAVLGLLLAVTTGCKPSAPSADNSSVPAATGGAGKPLTIALMPKSKGNGYFIVCRQGAEDAAKELGVKLLYDGPTDPDPAKQNEIVETWITRGVHVIAAACENREGISTAL